MDEEHDRISEENTTPLDYNDNGYEEYCNLYETYHYDEIRR